MKIAVSTVCLHTMPWREAFKLSGASGFTQLELLMIPGWQHVQPGEIPAAELAAEAKACGLAIVALHAGGIDGTSAEALARSLAHISRVADCAAELGARIVVCSGTATPAGTDARGRAAILARIAGGVGQFEPELARRRVTLGLENHCGCQLETLDDYRQLFERLPRSEWIGITADTGHFTASGVDPAEFVRAFGPRVVHVHVKDHIGTRSVGLGRGKTDNRAVVAELSRHGFDGFYSAEMEVEDMENIEQYMHEALPYIQGLGVRREA